MVRNKYRYRRPKTGGRGVASQRGVSGAGTTPQSDRHVSLALDTDEITFSEQLFRIFEFEPDLQVTLERIARRVHPEDVQTLSEKIEMARKGIEEQDYEIRLLTPNGSKIISPPGATASVGCS